MLLFCNNKASSFFAISGRYGYRNSNSFRNLAHSNYPFIPSLFITHYDSPATHKPKQSGFAPDGLR